MILNLTDVKGFILSPGNIFWERKPGVFILISKKADFMNLQLIEKLINAKHSVLIEDQINQQLFHDFLEYFKSYKLEALVREKLNWRTRLKTLFFLELGGDDVTQFEIDQLAWKFFSKIDYAEGQKIIDTDIDLFKRSMSIASSYTLCAFLLGYYSDEFLSKLYNETLLDLMDLNISLPIGTIKEKLETIRKKESLEAEDNQTLDNILQLSCKKSLLLGERFDGSGFMKINKREMTDLELLLVAISRHYDYSNRDYKTIFNEIKNATFECEEKVLTMLKACIEIKKEAAVVELRA